jgi:hypothetical protein
MVSVSDIDGLREFREEDPPEKRTGFDAINPMQST